MATNTYDQFENLRVGPPLGLPGLAVIDAAIEYLRSDKDVHFTNALITNAQEQENIAGLLQNRYNIESISIISDQNLAWEVYFFTTVGFEDADLDLDTFLDSIFFARADGAQIAGAGSFYYAAHGLRIPYTDADTTTTLHVSLVNRDPVAKVAGGAGEVVLRFGMRPTA